MSVQYEVSDRVAVVTIDRPQKRNAMDLEVFEQLGQAARRAGEDETAGAVLVRGAGETFSSGIDVGVLGSQLGDGGVEEGFIAGLQDALTAFEEMDKPTLAAIDGPCFGAGLQLAIACHLRAVAPGASLSVMEVRWALVPDLGGTWRLPRLIGVGRATELALTGRRVDAEEAVRIGLAEVTVASVDEAFELAVRLARGPGAVRRIPRLVRENAERPRDEGLAAERAAQLACIGGPDFREAVAAQLERREPDYTGA